MTSTGIETTVQVAVVQAAAVPFDTEACVDKAVRLIGEAAAKGAKVILFPEAFIVGYPKGLGYGLVIGARDAAGARSFESTSTRRLKCQARRLNAWARRRQHTVVTSSWA